jgi:hypothetical protein
VAFAAGPALFFLHAMSKARNIIGALTGIILILSSGAHSFMGWKRLREQLIATNAPDDLINTLAIGWNFAGLAILIFGCILLGVFVQRIRGYYAPLWPARLIGLAYTIAGLVAYKMSGNNFFMTIFVVPGILIALASWGSDADSDG